MAQDRLAEFCKLHRQDTDAKKEIMCMRLPVYNAPAKKSIELPWHSSTFTGSGYYTHNTEGYVPKPESLIIPSQE